VNEESVNTRAGAQPTSRAVHGQQRVCSCAHANFTSRTRWFARKSPPDLDDRRMGINDLRARRPGQGDVADRSDGFDAQGRTSGLVVVSASLAIVGAVLTVASSPDEVSMVLGLALFVTGAAITVASASSLPHRLTMTTLAGRLTTTPEDVLGAGTPSSLNGSLASIPLRPDPEQVVGRRDRRLDIVGRADVH
jgi:hypothetical protein